MGASLRDLQLCEFGILKDIKRVCEENHITYYLSSGTLLGAVRHKGFIPWDDDIDIEMPYPDYLRFVAVAQEALGPGYFLQNRDTDPAFCGLFSKVRKNNTTMLSKYEIGIAGHHGGLDRRVSDHLSRRLLRLPVSEDLRPDLQLFPDRQVPF